MGSKEGWTPATFKSTRQNRAKDSKEAAQQRPEDFMDEEDMREAEEARNMSTAEEYAALGSTGEDPKRHEAFMDIFRPQGETVGVRLLKRMGWKEGQGIGPKVRRKADLDENHRGNDEAAPTHLFAPEDPPMISFNRKFDHKGLGLEVEPGLGSESNKLSTSTTLKRTEESSEDDNQSFILSKTIRKGGNKIKTKIGGIGIGILNDTGSDDDDPFQMGPAISYNRVIGGVKKSQKKKDVAQTASNPLLKERPIFMSKKVKGKAGFRKCHDGRLPLEGFVMSTELDSFTSLNLQDEKYKPPKVPDGWVSEKQPSKENSREAYMSTADAAKLSKMDAKTRATLLGEEEMPGKSVFDFLTPAARDRIVSASGRSNLPAALSEKPPQGFEATQADRIQDLIDLVPQLDTEVAVQALSRGIGGWMPYAEDEGKRARYRIFLEIRAGVRDGLPERLEKTSKDDWVNEMNEFARAAQVFKPVTGMMASRFTSSSSRPQLASDRLGSVGNGQVPQSQPLAKPEDSPVNAAKMGMFGPLTRSVKNFYPTRLLCKRFNVKPPANVQLDPGNEVEKSGVAPSTASSRFQSVSYQEQPDKALRVVSKIADQRLLQASSEMTLRSNKNTSQAIPAAIVDPERNEALEAERPSDEVFKAIFGSDDDEDEDE